MPSQWLDAIADALWTRFFFLFFFILFPGFISHYPQYWLGAKGSVLMRMCISVVRITWKDVLYLTTAGRNLFSLKKKSVHLLPSWYDGNHPGWPGLLQAKCANAPINNIFICFALFKMHSIFNIFWNSALPTLPGNRYDWVNSLNPFDEPALGNNSNSVPLMCQTTKRVQSNLNSNWVWLNVWFPIMQINVLIIHL